METIGYRGQSFFTDSGRQILFNGLNVLCRDPQMGYCYPGFADGLSWFRESGFNLIRLGIFWDGVEPEPGKYDRAYLEKVKEIVKEAEKNGIYVMLDMQQGIIAPSTGKPLAADCPWRDGGCGQRQYRIPAVFPG